MMAGCLYCSSMTDSLFNTAPSAAQVAEPKATTVSVDSSTAAMLDLIQSELAERGLGQSGRSALVRLAVADLYNRLVIRHECWQTTDGGCYAAEVLARCHQIAAKRIDLDVGYEGGVMDDSTRLMTHPNAFAELSQLAASALVKLARR